MLKNKKICIITCVSLIVFSTSSANAFALDKLDRNSIIIKERKILETTKSLATNNMLTFDNLFNIDKNYITKTIEISNVYYDAIDKNRIQFNLDKAIQLTNKSSNLKIDGVLNININKVFLNSNQILDELIKYLNTIGVNLAQSIKENYIQSINNILKGGNSYSIIFALQDSSDGKKVVAVPLQFEIKEISAKRHSYNLSIQALRVVDNE